MFEFLFELIRHGYVTVACIAALFGVLISPVVHPYFGSPVGITRVYARFDKVNVFGYRQFTPTVSRRDLSYKVQTAPRVSEAQSYDSRELQDLQIERIDCKRISEVKILQELGHGNYRVTFLVRLPPTTASPEGRLAVAKRCRNAACEESLSKSNANEALLFEGLFRQFGPAALPIFGYCGFGGAIPKKLKNEFSREMVYDFSRGATIFSVLGSALSPVIIENKRLAPVRTERDFESLRNIARIYDEYEGGSLRLGGYGSDNHAYFQYIRSKSTGRIHHIDSSNCARGTNSTLVENCVYLFRRLASIEPSNPIVNCTRAYSRELVAAGVDLVFTVNLSNEVEEPPIDPNGKPLNFMRLYDVVTNNTSDVNSSVPVP